ALLCSTESLSSVAVRAWRSAAWTRLTSFSAFSPAGSDCTFRPALASVLREVLGLREAGKSSAKWRAFLQSLSHYLSNIIVTRRTAAVVRRRSPRAVDRCASEHLVRSGVAQHPLAAYCEPWPPLDTNCARNFVPEFRGGHSKCIPVSRFTFCKLGGLP